MGLLLHEQKEESVNRESASLQLSSLRAVPC